MADYFFLHQIKQTNGVMEKGIVVKDSLDAALQGFHAYFGAYGYGKDANTDYVQCMITDMAGLNRRSEVDDRRPTPEPEPEPEPETETEPETAE
jgi:hypothetical protein